MAENEKKVITVQKGSTKTALKLAVELSLPELRKLLISKNLMAEEDLFADANGAEIRKSDEAEFLIKDAIGTGTSLTLKSTQLSKTITVQKGTVKTPYQVNLDQKLSELRVVLVQANLMSANDLFQNATDVISKKNENNVIVQDSLKNDTLTIVSNVWE